MIDRLRNRITKSERKGGFTLIELLVVLIIIAVLLAIAIPSYLGFKGRAEQRAAEANVRTAIPAVEAYYSDNGTYVGVDGAGVLAAIDAGVSATITFGTVTATTYCIEDFKGTKLASYSGPGGDVVQVACP